MATSYISKFYLYILLYIESVTLERRMARGGTMKDRFAGNLKLFCFASWTQHFLKQASIHLSGPPICAFCAEVANHPS